MRSLEPASPEASSQDYYAAFFQLWNAQKYYEAHDVLEQLWLVEKNVELARFYQALIQAAGRLFICRKTSSNHRMPSMDVDCVRQLRLFELALRNLEGFPIIRELTLAVWQALRVPRNHRRFQKNPWSPETAPRLALV